jgi:hypothetical protein
MEYKIIYVRTVKSLVTNFSKATKELTETVNAELQNGWGPIGGVAIGKTQNTGEPHLFQAMIRR